MIRNRIPAALAAALLIAAAPGAPSVTGAQARAQGSAQASPPAIPKPDAQATAIRRWREQHETEIVKELTTLVALPNHASNAADIRRNAEAIKAMLDRRGLAGRLLENGSFPPAVYGELTMPGATPYGRVLRTLRWPAGHAVRVDDAALPADASRAARCGRIARRGESRAGQRPIRSGRSHLRAERVGRQGADRRC